MEAFVITIGILVNHFHMISMHACRRPRVVLSGRVRQSAAEAAIYPEYTEYNIRLSQWHNEQ